MKAMVLETYRMIIEWQVKLFSLCSAKLRRRRASTDTADCYEVSDIRYDIEHLRSDVELDRF